MPFYKFSLHFCDRIIIRKKIDFVIYYKIHNCILKISASVIFRNKIIGHIHEKNDFAEEFKILLDTDLKIILVGHQKNFVETLKLMSNTAKDFNILTTVLSVLRNYSDSLIKLLF